ncbi:MAG: MoxR family ATPase [Desulfuromonadales bacterium]|nr:MoxR family ATPase [Desulfuromonadales bacterium]
MDQIEKKLPGRKAIINVIDTLLQDHLQGKSRALRLAMTALLSGGHLLIEDIPGLGKTTLAIALANALGLSFGRVQCTSDLLPSDITGMSVFNRDENSFRFIEGPIFNNIVLIDEINRAMPKTQSALLEAMEERRVTVEGKTWPLPNPFLVMATQNPAEQVGTYLLPESQMDRFLITTDIGYPPEAMEKAIIRAGSIREDIRRIEPMVTEADILKAQATVHAGIYLGDKVVDYIYRLAAASREHRFILAGISTRGSLSLAEAAKATAFLAGRDYVAPEDVQAVVLPAAAHRLILRAEQETIDKREVLQSVMESVAVPLA